MVSTDELAERIVDELVDLIRDASHEDLAELMVAIRSSGRPMLLDELEPHEHEYYQRVQVEESQLRLVK